MFTGNFLLINDLSCRCLLRSFAQEYVVLSCDLSQEYEIAWGFEWHAEFKVF